MNVPVSTLTPSEEQASFLKRVTTQEQQAQLAQQYQQQSQSGFQPLWRFNYKLDAQGQLIPPQLPSQGSSPKEILPSAEPHCHQDVYGSQGSTRLPSWQELRSSPPSELPPAGSPATIGLEPLESLRREEAVQQKATTDAATNLRDLWQTQAQTAEMTHGTDRYVILPGRVFAKPKDIYVESLPNGAGRHLGGCIAMSLENLLNRYDALDRHYYRLKEENAKLRSLVYELYRAVPKAQQPHTQTDGTSHQEEKPSTTSPQQDGSRDGQAVSEVKTSTDAESGGPSVQNKEEEQEEEARPTRQKKQGSPKKQSSPQNRETQQHPPERSKIASSRSMDSSKHHKQKTELRSASSLQNKYREVVSPIREFIRKGTVPSAASKESC